MQGGLFGLTSTQKTYLYIAQLIPALIVYTNDNLIFILAFLQLFYLASSYFYIKYLSIEKQLYPYLFYETSKLSVQKQKGLSLAISAYLLITVYGIIATVFKIGKVMIPEKILVEPFVLDHWMIAALLLLINPVLEQWFWRLFQPKTMQENYEKNWLINISYLIFHFVLFSKYLGIWRALPLVTSFFSVGRSMSHIKNKYGFISAIITHYGITIAGFTLAFYIKYFTTVQIIEKQ